MDLERVLKFITALLLCIIVLLIFIVWVLRSYQVNPDFLEPKMVPVLSWEPKDITQDLPLGSKGNLINYGYLLASESAKWMGPMAEKGNPQYAGNNLACKNCHLDVGTRAGSASWVGITNRFPQFRARENKIGTIEDRINGCMERSMNGRKLPENSKQMKALVAYMDWLSEDVPVSREKEFVGFPSLKIPTVAADPSIGKTIYLGECQICHGENGEGIWLSDSSKGYQYPPVWGKDSYNHGAGMNRVLTAAQFIKGNMPWGQATWDKPKLSDEEAYHVAAYLVSFDRPTKADAERDFPDLKLKPVSTPYGPWKDEFSAVQHKYGPFPPIISFYKRQYNLTKTK